MLVCTGGNRGLGRKGTEWGYVLVVEPVGHEDRLVVGVWEGEQSYQRCLGAWPEKLGGWQLQEKTGAGTGLEKVQVQTFHLGHVLFEILIYMVISSTLLTIPVWSLGMGSGMKAQTWKALACGGLPPGGGSKMVLALTCDFTMKC